MATSRIAEHVGRVLGDRYRLTRPLGTGASAHVYVAEDVTLRRRVAVKLLHPGLADDDAFLRRFQAEARVVAGLRHPHIVRVYDWGEDDGAPFLVMELLEGGSLRSVLDRGHLLTPAQGALIGGDAARALDYAHRRGLVHRDIKPANLLFDEEGQVSIADFGLARALAEATWTEPAGAVLGTARYAAPEQVRGVALDGKADVYALALVLVEAVTGRVPFATDTTIGTLMARVDQPLPLPDQLGGPLAVALAGAGMPDVADRADAAELARALEVAANELPAPQPLPLAGPLLTGEVEEDADLTAMPARPVPFDGEAKVAVADGQTVPTAPLPGRRRRRRRWGEWGLILVAVAALLGAAGLVAVRLLTPSHAVPSVAHQTEADARRTLSPLHFHVGMSTAYDDQVPKGSVIRQHPDPGRSLREHSTVTIVVSLGPAPVPVPDLTGLTVDQATQRLAGAQLVLGASTPRSDSTVKAGAIISWAGEGAQLPKGSRVDVVVSTGPPTVAVPDVHAAAAKSFAAAAAALQGAGLTAVEDDEFNDTVPKGQVVGTSPAAGSQAPTGSAVTVIISKGPDLVPVADVRGLSVDGATKALEAQGFTVSGVVGAPDRAVSFTSPAGHALVKRGSAVRLYTS